MSTTPAFDLRSLPRPRLRHRVGLSLVELTIVVLTISILAAAGVTRLSSRLSTHSVDGMARLLQTELQNAQQEALATSTTVTIAATCSTNTYTISALRNGVSTIIRTVCVADDPWKCKLTSLLSGPSKTSVTTATVTINGAGVFSGDLTFVLTNGSSSASIRIESSSRRVLRE